MENKPLLEGYIHLRPDNKIPFPDPKIDQEMTIAYVLKKEIVGSKLFIGISVCSKKDQFCKKIGRDIAHGRMLKNPYGTEKFSNIDTEVFKSEKGRQELHKFILNIYTPSTSVERIKRNIFMLA